MSDAEVDSGFRGLFTKLAGAVSDQMFILQKCLCILLMFSNTSILNSRFNHEH